MKKLFKTLIFVALVMFSGRLFSLSNVQVAQAISQPENVLATATPPSSYDLRDYIDIKVENQNPYGICWAYASLTSLETYLALNYNEYYDFSELHLVVSSYLEDGYYTSLGNALDSGGSFNNLFTYIQKSRNIVLEEEYDLSSYNSYSNKYEKMLEDYETVNSHFYPIAQVNDTCSFQSVVGNKSGKDLTSYRNKIKSHIMQYGSLTAGINASSLTYSSTSLCVTDDTLLANPSSAINHLISIVGWDDSYNADGEWSTPGAYLCLNSWGTGFGDSGYFYISYNDYFIEYVIQGIASASLFDLSTKTNSYIQNPEKTFTQLHTLSGMTSMYTTQVLDVSAYKNQNLSTIDSFIKGSSSSFYIKFFSTKQEAFSGLNSINNSSKVDSTLAGEYSIYNTFSILNSSTKTPICVENNYMAVVIQTINPYQSASISTYTSYGISIDASYYSNTGLGNFTETWNEVLNGGSVYYSLPLRATFLTDKATISGFSGDGDCVVNGNYLKSNAIFLGETISCTTTNVESIDYSNVKICKTYKNGNTDVTDKFTIKQGETSNSIAITMAKSLDSTFTVGNYIISIPTSEGTFYRIVEVQDVVSYTITYHLNGGTTTSNPKYFTNKQSTITLNSPHKDGYEFLGWFLDEEFAKAFDGKLPKSNLDLYAKYDFASPTLLSKSKDVDCTYSKDLSVVISVNAKHALENSYNTISYQWFKKGFNDSSYSKLEGQTSSSITLTSVSDSAYYACQITISITDPSLTSSPCVKTLELSEKSQIKVKINKLIYDMSKVKWDYEQAFSYDTTEHSVKLINLPEGVTANYSNNSYSNIGKYIAKAELIYDDMDGNAYAEPVDDLSWEIRKAKITITIQNIISEDAIPLEELKLRFACELQHEYLPSEYTSLKEKLEYLHFNFIGPIDTAQPTIKKISGETLIFDIYEITIIDGEYRYVAKMLTDKNSSGITSYNPNGFTADCEFSVEYISSTSEETKKLLEKSNLSFVKGYHLKFSYLNENDKYTVTLPIERNDLLAQLHVYIVKDGKLVRVNQTDITTKGITIEASELDNEFLIVEADTGHTSNTQKLAIILISCGFVILYVCIVVEHIRKKRRFY